MFKRKTVEVDLGRKYSVPTPDGKKNMCIYCDKIISSGVTRVKEHLAGIPGNVAACEKVPRDVRKEVLNAMKQKKKDKAETRINKEHIEEEMMNHPEYITNEGNEEDEDENENEEDVAMRRAVMESRNQFEADEIRRREKHLGAGSSSGAQLGRSTSVRPDTNITARRTDPLCPASKGSRQPKIKGAFRNLREASKKLGKAMTQFFVFNGIAFNAADSPFYQGMVNTIAELGPGVKPPTPYEMSKVYLNEEVEYYKSYLRTFYTQWDEYGVTLMCDGWTTQNRRSIINFLVYSPAGTIFLKSVDASAHIKNGRYILHLLKEVIRNEIGEKRVVQVVTDNGPNYKLAGELLMEEMPHIFWTPCAAHCIDLMLEEIAEDPAIKDLLTISRKMTGFIYNHSWALAIMRRETQNGELIRAGITRFATHFLSLESILKHKMDLRRMINAEDWLEHYTLLRGQDKFIADDIYGLIYGEEYWDQIVHVTSIFRPLVKVLRMVDNDDKAEMGHLYEAMDRAKEELKKNVGRGYRKWWAIIDKRWDRQLHRPLHACGYFLNPHCQYSDQVKNDDEVISGFRHVVERLEQDPLTRIHIKREGEKWRLKSGIFSYQEKKDSIKHLTPAEWWAIIGREEAPNLARLAAKVLSQTVSSSNCERNWVTFSLIHTPVRNRLTMENLNKLVFVHYNMRLRKRNLSRREKGDMQIDLDHIFHEEDPVTLWSREQEPSVLDNNENSWLVNERNADLTREIDNDNDFDDDYSNDDSNNGGDKGSGPSGGNIHRTDRSGFDSAEHNTRGASGGGQGDYAHVYRRSSSRGKRQVDEDRGNDDLQNIRHRNANVTNEPSEDEGYSSFGPSGHSLASVPEESSYGGSYYNHVLMPQESSYGESDNSCSYGASNYNSTVVPIQESSSPFDNMTNSFFDGTEIQYLYPPQGVPLMPSSQGVQFLPHPYGEVQSNPPPMSHYFYNFAGFQNRRNDDRNDDNNESQYQAPARTSFWY